jgi:hypothetical protein
MNEPTKEEEEKEQAREKTDEARHQEILSRLTNMQEHSSQEHETIVSEGAVDQLATRAHISSETSTIRADQAHNKRFMEGLLKAMKRFLSRMGIGTDDL